MTGPTPSGLSQDGQPSPAELWKRAVSPPARFNHDEYRRLLIEHGHIIPLDPGEKPEPLPCGWPGPIRDDFDPEERDDDRS